MLVGIVDVVEPVVTVEVVTWRAVMVVDATTGVGISGIGVFSDAIGSLSALTNLGCSAFTTAFFVPDFFVDKSVVGKG